MAYIKDIFEGNYLEYASYVIKERAIPYIEDGLKPVQRRILHSLYTMDDGKLNKVANVVGNTMQYHPHGDASIYSALVHLANKELFIQKQGNFGNIFTGDPASAARYIECRLHPLAKEVLFNSEITSYEATYDGRNMEPRYFPAKIPVVLIQGAEGIAVGMATHILPHNFTEVLHAMKAALQGEHPPLYPDFLTAGFIDVSDYQDGMGKVLVRAKLEITDDKTVVIRELPFGSTTESLIASIDNAAKKNKIMVAKISDFSSSNVEIELKLKRGFHASEIIDALYAFTDCQKSISVNCLLIEKNTPVLMTVSEIIAKSTEQLKQVLEAELNLEKNHLLARRHRRTLELIFVIERIYICIEKMNSPEAIRIAVLEGFVPFQKEITDDITDEDIEKLLNIPIRRISLYDLTKARKELEDIQMRIDEINILLGDICLYATNWIDGILKKYGHLHPRRTEIMELEQISARTAAIRDRELRYNGNNGYVGYDLKEGPKRCTISVYDKILYIDRTGNYKIIDVPEKMFIGYRLRYINLADVDTCKNTIFSALYKNEKGFTYLKRFRIDKFIANKDYSILPNETCELLELISEESGRFVVHLNPSGKMKKVVEYCALHDYEIRGASTRGFRITNKSINKIEYQKTIPKDDNPTADMPLFTTP